MYKIIEEILEENNIKEPNQFFPITNSMYVRNNENFLTKGQSLDQTYKRNFICNFKGSPVSI